MPDHHQSEPAEPVEETVSVSHVVHTLRAYMPTIGLSLAAVAVGYTIIALLLYLAAPSQRLTSQRFRLDFEGADTGKYPNGIKFSTSEIVGTPILLKVFQDDHLDVYTNFGEFSRSIFILEANAEYERLAAEYQSRLADPKLGPVDRERIQKEWEGKAASLAKSDYSINYMRMQNAAIIPESVVKKVLVDVLNDWAAYAIHERQVLKYRMAILSPEAIVRGDVVGQDYVIAIQILRSKINRVFENIDSLSEVPGAELVRTPKDRMSLQEIRLRLEEIERFRLDPLISLVRANGMIANSQTTVSFLESQLAYDQRLLKADQESAESIRQAIALYANEQRTTESNRAGLPAALQGKPGQPGNGETLMPQLSDSFIDRLVTLTHQSADVAYRQKLVDDYRRCMVLTIPVQTAVAYDQEILDLVKRAPAGSSPQNMPAVRAEIAATENEVRQLVGRVNEVYEIISRNLNPATELVALTAPPTTRIERPRSLVHLAEYGLLVLMIALPVIVLFCLLHARIREEETAQGYVGPGYLPGS